MSKYEKTLVRLKQGRGRPRRSEPALSRTISVPMELDRALRRYLEEMAPKPTITSVFTLALSEYLTARGYWDMAKRTRKGE
jgi:hypothetical protein